VGGRIRIIRISVRSVWVVTPVPAPPRTPPPWRGEVADKDDLVEMLEATKPINSIEVAIVEAVKPSKSQGGIHQWSVMHRHWGNRTWCEGAAHSHPGGGINAPPHLRHRSRGCENACCRATKENEFSPVHSVIGFQRFKPPGFESCGNWKDKRY